MNVHFSYKAAKTPEVEKELQNQIEKLERRLHAFRPELVHLHGSIEPNSTRASVSVALNLRLPSGQLAVHDSAPTGVQAAKAAFSDLMAQLNKHKELLRSQHKWRRHSRQTASAVPFEKTVAAVPAPGVTNADIRSYVNVNLARLERFVERELRYREAAGLIDPGWITREDVIDEAIATALANGEERPQPLSLERWLYRLSIRALSEIDARDHEHVPAAVPLETSARKQNVRATDDSQLQYHQPDELLLEEEVIADRRALTPEEIAASDEVLQQVERALLHAPARDREAFVLFAIEGFTIEEIAAATDRSVTDVRASIAAAREHLRRTLPGPEVFRERLLHYSRTA
ncbi:MAG TPA: sigma factor-like helix-turn-helix DNA-binding protein [Terriglobales bacterium]|nr:sigma factor-like helix-turn-helix DNA-binding protein [Terriglobales bacterium]